MKIKISGIVKVSRETKNIIPFTYGLLGFSPKTGKTFLDIFVDSVGASIPICRFCDDSYVRLVEPAKSDSFYVAKLTHAVSSLGLRRALTEALVKKGISDKYAFK